MLTALERGVKGGVWFSLIDKVYRPANLQAAFTQVKRNQGAAGVDHVSVDRFEANLEAELARLHESLKAGTYCPSAVKRVWIDKPGKTEKRPLGIPTVRDRVVQSALRNVLEPIFERDFAAQSYGFRPERGCKDALRRVRELLDAGYTHVVDADLKGYFDNIPHEPLLAQMKERVADSRVLALLEAFLGQSVMDDLTTWTPESGTPQGAVISPLLANCYLDPLDHLMEQQGYQMVRYADDFVILCRNADEAEAALTLVQQWTADAGLTLHPEKTRLADLDQGDSFDFLGYHFERNRHWPTRTSEKQLRMTLKPKTRRTNGHSLEHLIAEINPILRGWFEYFKHGPRHTYPRIDQWVRMRLRSILRKRSKRKGRGRGYDHNRWPNAYFHEHGLFCLERAWRSYRQSPLG